MGWHLQPLTFGGVQINNTLHFCYHSLSSFSAYTYINCNLLKFTSYNNRSKHCVIWPTVTSISYRCHCRHIATPEPVYPEVSAPSRWNFCVFSATRWLPSTGRDSALSFPHWKTETPAVTGCRKLHCAFSVSHLMLLKCPLLQSTKKTIKLLLTSCLFVSPCKKLKFTQGVLHNICQGCSIDLPAGSTAYSS